jgi:nucleoside-diphosphate-sugar epimerase
VQTTYNVTSMSFTPAELAASIRKFIPSFQMQCSPDFRNDIAKSWPCSVDDSRARTDWGWSPNYDLDVSAASYPLLIMARLTVSVACLDA